MFYKITLGDELESNKIPVLLAYISYDVVAREYKLYRMHNEVSDDYSKAIIEETLNSIEKDIKALSAANEIHKYIQPFVNCIKIKPVTKEEGIEEVLNFIDETINLYEQSAFFEEHGVSVYRFYTNGGCGEFFTILKAQFPFARSFATPEFSHILTEIDGVLYDVRGIYDCLFEEELNNFIINYNPDEDQCIKNSLDEHESYYIYLPDGHPAQKLLENYAFSVNGDWGWGPVFVRNFQTLQTFTQEQREKVFDFLGRYNTYWFERRYNNYIERIYNNDDYIIENMRNEAEGVYIPV